MPAAPRPSYEHDRLQALVSLRILDTPPAEHLDDMVRAASKMMNMPVAGISLVAESRQWFKSIFGLPPGAADVPRDLAFCAYTILNQVGPCLISDATADWRVSDNPLVTGTPSIRSYAGAPLLDKNRLPIGALCLIDFKPRSFTEADIGTLMNLASVVSKSIRLHGAIQALKERDFSSAKLLATATAQPISDPAA